jgi:hypothetical protein
MADNSTSFYSLFIGPDRWLRSVPKNPVLHEMPLSGSLSVKEIEDELLGTKPDPPRLAALRAVISLAEAVSRHACPASSDKCDLCSATASSQRMEIKTTRKGKTTTLCFFICAACTEKLNKK